MGWQGSVDGVWIEEQLPSERKFLGPKEIDKVSKDIEIIKKTLQASVDRQKKYDKNQQRPLKFKVRDNLFLKVAPMRRVMRFGKKGKLSP